MLFKSTCQKGFCPLGIHTVSTECHITLISLIDEVRPGVLPSPLLPLAHFTHFNFILAVGGHSLYCLNSAMMDGMLAWWHYVPSQSPNCRCVTSAQDNAVLFCFVFLKHTNVVLIQYNFLHMSLVMLLTPMHTYR